MDNTITPGPQRVEVSQEALLAAAGLVYGQEILTVKELKKLLKGKHKPESRYREAVEHITHTVFEWLTQNPDDHKLRDLLVKKLGKEKLEKQQNDPNERKNLLSSKTLMTTVKSGEGATSTVSVLNAYYYAAGRQQQEESEQQERMERIQGVYFQVNTHKDAPGRFQESIFWFEADRVRMRFVNQQMKVLTHTMKYSWISNRHLMISSSEQSGDADEYVIYYLYVGSSLVWDFLQCVFLYSSKLGNTVANLGIFCRIDLEKLKMEEEDVFYNFVPRRGIKIMDPNRESVKWIKSNRKIKILPEIKSSVKPGYPQTVLDNIQYFLYHEGRTISTLLFENERPFDFSRQLALKPGPNRTIAKRYRSYMPLLGDYYIYFNEGWPSLTTKESNRLRTKSFSTVGRALMQLCIDGVSGILRCRVLIQKNEAEDLHYEGLVMNNTLTSSAYLNLSLYLLPGQGRCLNLLFNVVSDYKLIGAYNVAYTSPGEIGAGVVVAVRQSMIDKGGKLPLPAKPPKCTDGDWREQLREAKKKTHAFIPTSLYSNPKTLQQQVPPLKEQRKLDLEDRIVHYLARNRRAQIRIPSFRETIDQVQENTYQGLYRLYTLVPGSQTIRENLVAIYPHGAAYCWAQNDNLLQGSARELGRPPRLTMVLRSVEPLDQTQSSYLCIRVEDVAPREGKTLYVGSYAGFHSSGYQLPIATYAVLIFQQKDVPSLLENKAATHRHKPLVRESEEAQHVPNIVWDFLQLNAHLSSQVDIPVFDKGALERFVAIAKKIDRNSIEIQ